MNRDKANEGFALRIIRECEGWQGPMDPEEFQRLHEADEARLLLIIEKIRTNERRRIAEALSAQANAMYNRHDNQHEQDYPSNTLDRVAYALRCDLPLDHPEVKLGKPRPAHPSGADQESREK